MPSVLQTCVRAARKFSPAKNVQAASCLSYSTLYGLPENSPPAGEESSTLAAITSLLYILAPWNLKFLNLLPTFFFLQNDSGHI
jgi:hypothetical protein